MADIFREIDDELRRDKAAKAWERYQKPIIALAPSIVIAAAAWRFYDYNRTQEGPGGRRLLPDRPPAGPRDGKSAESEAALGEIAKSGPAGYALLARFRAAGESAARDPDGAVKIFDAISADRFRRSTMRDVARLRAAILRVDKADAAELQRRLEPLAQAGQPFRNPRPRIARRRRPEAQRPRRRRQMARHDRRRRPGAGRNPPARRSAARAREWGKK